VHVHIAYGHGSAKLGPPLAGFVLRNVHPVSWMTSCASHIGPYGGVTPLQQHRLSCRARAAWQGLVACCVGRRRAQRLEESFVQGVQRCVVVARTTWSSCGAAWSGSRRRG